MDPTEDPTENPSDDDPSSEPEEDDEDGQPATMSTRGLLIALGVVVVIAIAALAFVLLKPGSSGNSVSATVSLGPVADAPDKKCPVLPSGITFSFTMTTADGGIYGARSGKVAQTETDCTITFVFDVPDSTLYSVNLMTPPSQNQPTDWTGPIYKPEDLSAKGYTVSMGVSAFTPAGQPAQPAPPSGAPMPPPSGAPAGQPIPPAPPGGGGNGGNSGNG